MPLSAVELTEITEQHLQALVDDSVREARRIDYKASVGANDEARREFLADVSSFANASRGDLLIGVEDTDGVASAITGIPASDVDAEVLRLENMIRDGIDPRIPGIQTQPVPLSNGRSVLSVANPAKLGRPSHGHVSRAVPPLLWSGLTDDVALLTDPGADANRGAGSEPRSRVSAGRWTPRRRGGPQRSPFQLPSSSSLAQAPEENSFFISCHAAAISRRRRPLLLP